MLTYSQYLTTLATLTAIAEDNTDFLVVVPNASEYANNRICRELDMIVENVRDSSLSTSALNRNFTLPVPADGAFQVITAVNVITPAATAPESGTRNPCTPVALEVLDAIYPSTTGAGVPSMFHFFSQMTGQTGIVFGPWPDAAYRVEVIGKVIPAPLSSTVTTTFLSTYLPELYVAASMIFLTGYLKNFGGQADDPKQAMSWDQQYKELRESAATFEARKRFSGASWTSKPLEPTAQAQRG